MPIPVTLPRGCTRSRGQADVRHLRSLGGDLAQQANRLYMLTVRRESLVNKKTSLELRLREITTQLREIEADIRESETVYKGVLGRQRCRTKKNPRKGAGGNGRGLKTVPLKF